MNGMSLGDGFSQRKHLRSEFETWINRLSLSGKEETKFDVISILEKSSAKAGTLKEFKRIFTIEECLEKLHNILKEDKELALRISLTNQIAKARLVSLDGEEEELTIPELIVLKNEIAPKLEEIERAIPVQNRDHEVTKEDVHYIKWREIKGVTKRVRELSKDGFQRDIDKTVGYKIREVTDYGFAERIIFDRIDRIQQYQHRLKEAINQANKTLLVQI